MLEPLAPSLAPGGRTLEGVRAGQWRAVGRRRPARRFVANMNDCPRAVDSLLIEFRKRRSTCTFAPRAGLEPATYCLGRSRSIHSAIGARPSTGLASLSLPARPAAAPNHTRPPRSPPSYPP